MKQNFIDTDYAQMWFEDGLICVVFKSNLIINLDIARNMVAERLKINNQIARPMLVDVSGIVSIDMPSRKFFASEAATQYVKAGAIVVKGLIPQFVTQVFMKIDKPKVPSRIFTNADKAVVWLEKYI
jgi:Na+/H+ antiporter NhaA